MRWGLILKLIVQWMLFSSYPANLTQRVGPHSAYDPPSSLLKSRCCKRRACFDIQPQKLKSMKTQFPVHFYQAVLDNNFADITVACVDLTDHILVNHGANFRAV